VCRKQSAHVDSPTYYKAQQKLPGETTRKLATEPTARSSAVWWPNRSSDAAHVLPLERQQLQAAPELLQTDMYQSCIQVLPV
jgi:hypothetical protein